MRKYLVLIIIVTLFLTASCAGGRPDISQSEEPQDGEEMVYEPTQEEIEALFIEALIDGMSLKEQVAQLFIISFGTEFTGAGGYILFSENITTVEATKALTGAASASSKIPPFICIDEEGGVVSRLSAANLPGYAAQPSAKKIGATGNAQNAYIAGVAIGRALFDIGVNVDFAPVADVLTNSRNTVIGSRAYGTDPEIVSEMASSFQEGLHACGIMSAPKHFPGHGGTTADSHTGPATSERSPEQLAAVEYIPFVRLIGEGAEFIMTGHIIVSGTEPDGLPATLSGYFMMDVLRGELGFDGIIVTDAMNMGAIKNKYTSGEAAVMAIRAGVDMILLPDDHDDAVKGILQAVDDGSISKERIRESLTRILRGKLAAGLISERQNR